MKKYKIEFEENGGEYYGELIITCEKLEKTDKRNVIKADNVIIECDENFVGKIEELPLL